MALLEVRRLRRSYPDGWVLHDISFTVGEGEILCLLSPSGFWPADVTHVPPHLRGFGLMFQESALFLHKNVFGDVALPARGDSVTLSLDPQVLTLLSSD